MTESTTTNYGWTKPELQKSPTTWGQFLNNDLDSIDSIVFSNQQGVSPVGSVTMFAGATPPTNWLLCQGQSLATTGTYAALFAIVGYAFGGSGANFNLPNFSGVFPTGAGGVNPLGKTGGAASVTLSAAQLPAHTHTITQVAHAHTATQPAHVHPDPGHTHGVNDSQHAHGSNLVKQGAGTAGLAAGGPFTISGSGNTDAAPTGISIQAATANLQAAGGDAVTVNATTPSGPTVTGSVGAGAVVPTVPPWLAINFIVRYK